MTDETTTPDIQADAPKIKYGFAVLVSENNDVFIEKDPKVFTVPVEREASLIEIRRYTSEILMDLQAQAAAEYSALRVSALLQDNTKDS